MRNETHGLRVEVLERVRIKVDGRRRRRRQRLAAAAGAGAEGQRQRRRRGAHRRRTGAAAPLRRQRAAGRRPAGQRRQRRRRRRRAGRVVQRPERHPTEKSVNIINSPSFKIKYSSKSILFHKRALFNWIAFQWYFFKTQNVEILDLLRGLSRKSSFFCGKKYQRGKEQCCQIQDEREATTNRKRYRCTNYGHGFLTVGLEGSLHLQSRDPPKKEHRKRRRPTNNGHDTKKGYKLKNFHEGTTTRSHKPKHAKM